jgi:hypothetical protein
MRRNKMEHNQDDYKRDAESGIDHASFMIKQSLCELIGKRCKDCNGIDEYGDPCKWRELYGNIKKTA